MTKTGSCRLIGRVFRYELKGCGFVSDGTHIMIINVILKCTVSGEKLMTKV